MQEKLLAAHLAVPLRVYAVWTEKLPGDGRAAWDDGGLADSRVVHYWDARDVVGRWFAAHLPTFAGRDWPPAPLSSAILVRFNVADALFRAGRGPIARHHWTGRTGWTPRETVGRRPTRRPMLA